MQRIKRTGVWVLAMVLAAGGAAMAQDAAKKQSGAGLQAQLEKLERAGWEAFKNRDTKGYTALCADGYTSVLADGNGEHDLKGTLDAMKQVTIHQYTLSNLKTTSLGPNVAILSYSAAINASIGGGQPQDMKLGVTDVYVKRGGQWKSVRYQETEVK